MRVGTGRLQESEILVRMMLDVQNFNESLKFMNVSFLIFDSGIINT
jgi:hypothetical protein